MSWNAIPSRILAKRTVQSVLCLLALVALLNDVTHAHPADEFCLPSEDAIDMALCEQLTALDSPNGGRATPYQESLVPLHNAPDPWSTMSGFVRVGIDHILPGGLDHILFVLALFLGATGTRSLIVHISTFTLAHTVTLGLAAAGFLAPASAIVEPLIALSIALVAFEQLYSPDLSRWRPAVVFTFGLLHGLGFAGFFGELGLPTGQFWSALIGFNIGVEIGQLSVVLAAATSARLLIAVGLSHRVYRGAIVIPGSIGIGLIGCWWAIERILLG